MPALLKGTQNRDVRLDCKIGKVKILRIPISTTMLATAAYVSLPARLLMISSVRKCGREMDWVNVSGSIKEASGINSAR